MKDLGDLFGYDEGSSCSTELCIKGNGIQLTKIGASAGTVYVALFFNSQDPADSQSQLRLLGSIDGGGTLFPDEEETVTVIFDSWYRIGRDSDCVLGSDEVPIDFLVSQTLEITRSTLLCSLQSSCTP